MSGTPAHRLLAVIVNYRTAELAAEAARALLAEIGDWPHARVVIVDNCSKDGSMEILGSAILQAPLKGKVRLVESARNGGYGYGNNLALRANLDGSDGGPRADYYYLLNPDAFPRPGAVRTLVEFLAATPHAGIAGSYIEGPDGTPHHTAFRFPSLGSELEAGLALGLASRLLADWVVPLPIPERRCQVDWLAGASMLIRRQVLETVGLFDEEFFLYYEEVDLCRRALQAGFPTYYLRDSVVTHIGSVSTGMKETGRRMPRFWFDSRRHYLRKHHGVGYQRACDLAYAAGRGLWEVRRRLQRKPDSGPPRLWWDFVRHSLRGSIE
ncbi:MAG: glycosyltransferase family 2 protein [Armatimonadota bacterium]|nr:glycosyltransferase family 2 protein [Armatimonadota bacterium]